MSTITVSWIDPNLVGSVTDYHIQLLDFNGAVILDQWETPPIDPADTSRSFSYVLDVPPLFPLTVKIFPVNLGVVGPATTYIINKVKPLAVTSLSANLA